MPTTVRDIVSAVINELSQVPGVATQLYAAGRIQQHVQDAFQLEFDDFFWPSYLAYVQSPLDGVTGSLTQDLIGPLGAISDYVDIQAVWPLNSNRKLRELSQSMNPFTLTGGSSWMYMMPDYSVPNRPFRVAPQGSVGPVVVLGLQRPKLPFSLEDKIYLDALLLQYDAAWMYCVDDGTIPAQVNKFQVLAQNRRKMVKAATAQHPIALDPRMPSDVGLGDPVQTEYFVIDKHPLA